MRFLNKKTNIDFMGKRKVAFVVSALLIVLSIATLLTRGLNFGLLTTIEMATAVLVYIPVAYMADRSTKKPFVLVTFIFFTLFPPPASFVFLDFLVRFNVSFFFLVFFLYLFYFCRCFYLFHN